MDVFLGQVMSRGGTSVCNFKQFYAVIGTSCLSYIFSILSFNVLYFISISDIPDAFFFFSNALQYVSGQFKRECSPVIQWPRRSGNTLSVNLVLGSKIVSGLLQPGFETPAAGCVEGRSSYFKSTYGFLKTLIKEC